MLDYFDTQQSLAEALNALNWAGSLETDCKSTGASAQTCGIVVKAQDDPMIKASENGMMRSLYWADVENDLPQV